MAASQSNRFKEGVTGVTNEVVSIPRSEKNPWIIFMVNHLHDNQFSLHLASKSGPRAR